MQQQPTSQTPQQHEHNLGLQNPHFRFRVHQTPRNQKKILTNSGISCLMPLHKNV
jgi:hypothetical protein